MSDEESTLEEYAEGLVKLGEFILAHQDLFLAKSRWNPERPPETELPDPFSINVQALDAADLAEKIRVLGSGDKYNETSEYFSSTGVKKSFGPHTLDVYATSSTVCTPKRRETRSVPRVQLTDEARAKIDAIRAECTTMETTEVVTEWECPPSLLNPGREKEATV